MIISTALSLALISVGGNATLSADRIKEHNSFLASTEVAGRMTGSAGERLAGDYIAKKFKEYGLIPAGGNGTYFQDVPITFGSEAGPGSSLKFTLSNGKTIECKGNVDFVPIVNTAEKTPIEAEVVFAGEGIVADQRNDYNGIDAKGKVVVVMNSADPKVRSFGNRGDIAKTHGAVGLIVVGPATPNGRKLPNSTRSNALNRESGLVGAAITSDIFEAIGNLKYEDAKTQAAGGRVMPGFARGVKVSANLEVIAKQVTGRNVIGLIPGNDSALKNQFVIFGAHYDHLGYGEVGARDGTETIHPGADDNGSGTAGMIELAKYFSESKSNKRSILIQLYTGEELGLRGSLYWVQNPTVDIKAVNCMFNFDMIGNLTEDKLQLDGFNTSPEWDGIFEKSKTKLVVQKNGGPRADSDQYSFGTNGIPVLFFHTGLHPRYHTDQDTSNTVNFEGAVKVLSYAIDLFAVVDQNASMITFQKGSEITKRQAPAAGVSGDPSSGRRVRVGLIPNYSDAGPGLLIDGTREGSPAEKAGLKAGDRLMKWNDKSISNIEDFNEILMSALPGVEVTLTIQRDGKEIKVKLTPEAIGQLLHSYLK
ncbi:MAG: M28 family peptidase [Fimbriimonadales bacterium]